MTGGEEVVVDPAKLAGTVTVKVLEHLRGTKIKVFTYKPKRGYKRARGHRSELSRITVESIGASARKRAPRKRAETAEEAIDGA
ncbi:MAG TPA: bL21 family ribosomal protein, partial [Gaiellales bacterium]|nr:bL21 family ribosomal protein [Gaiellales bacterium]